MNRTTLEQARAAKAKVLAALGEDVKVVGLGITRIGEGYGVKVNLEAVPDAPMPKDVEGVPLKVEVVGAIRKH